MGVKKHKKAKPSGNLERLHRLDKTEQTVKSVEPKQIQAAYQTFKQFPSFKKYQASYTPNYSRVDSALWRLHCEGFTIRQISKELRRLHKLNKLGAAPRRKGTNPNGQPYSIYYVHSHLDKLKKDCLDFNALHPEGLAGCPDCSDVVDCEACTALQYMPDTNQSVDLS